MDVEHEWYWMEFVFFSLQEEKNNNTEEKFEEI